MNYLINYLMVCLFQAQLTGNVSKLVQTVPKISEIDINPLIAFKDQIIAVDVRIRVEDKTSKSNI